MKPFIAILLLCLTVVAPSNAPAQLISETRPAAEQGNRPTAPPDQFEKILSGQTAIPVVSGEELENRLLRDADAVKAWVHRERHALTIFLIGGIASILSGIVASFILHRLLSRRMKDKAPSFRWQLFNALCAPLLLLAVLIAVFGFMLPVLHSLPGLYSFDARIFFTLVTLIAAMIGFRLVDLFHQSLANSGNNLDSLMMDIVRKLLKITLIAVTALFIGQSIFNLNITTLLAGAGVVGLAIAFASRETLSNFFGTLVIVLDRPFRIGDRIQVNGIDGIVKSVGMRSTRILTANESVFTVPNSQIETNSIENISSRGVIRYAFTLGLVYDTDDSGIRKAIKIIHDVADNFKGADAPKYKPRVFFDSFGNSGLNIRVILWFKTASFDTEETWRTELNLAILRRFNEEKIGMAYNTMTAYLYGDPGHPVSIRTE